MSQTAEAALIDADPAAYVKQALEALPSGTRLTREDTEAVYALAYQLVAQAQFEAAYRYFSFLTLYRPTEIKYLQGLALCYKMLQRYDAALGVYAFVAALEPENPQHTLSIAECLLLQREFDEAVRNVDLVLAYCAENPAADRRVRDRAQALKDLLSSGRKNSPGDASA